jgi:hypothetical protein
VRELGGRRRLAAALVAFGCAILVAGCSQMSNPTYDLQDVGCSTTDLAVVDEIGTRLTADGKLRNGRQVTSGDSIFVSAELHLRDDDRHTKGDVLTWVTDDVESGQFASVDIGARDDSTWPPADVDVTAPGARESRACVGPSLGKTPAQIQCEQDELQGGIPQDRDCEDL